MLKTSLEVTRTNLFHTAGNKSCVRWWNEASHSLCRVSAQLGLQVGVVYLFHVLKVEVDGTPMMGAGKTTWGTGGHWEVGKTSQSHWESMHVESWQQTEQLYHHWDVARNHSKTSSSLTFPLLFPISLFFLLLSFFSFLSFLLPSLPLLLFSPFPSPSSLYYLPLILVTGEE